jgi:aminoglycoside phosphotransferase (APT) family kinase protein
MAETATSRHEDDAGRPAPDFAPDRLDRYLRERIPGLDGAMALERIAGGQSNPTYFVTYPGRRLVLRKKPAGEVLPSAHAVDREYRVMTALGRTDVPVPRTLFYEDACDIVGTPLLCHGAAGGPGRPRQRASGMTPASAGPSIAPWRKPWQGSTRSTGPASGLKAMGRPGGYFARQIARWTTQWQLSRTKDLPDIERLIQWLPAHVPEG